MTNPRMVAFAFWLLTVPSTFGADWNQWRGPDRSGSAEESPRLRDALPEQGLAPLWKTAEAIPGGGNGGWSSPVVAAGKVYQYAHTRERRKGIELPAEQYPPLSEERRGELSATEIRDYETKRSAEQRERRDKLHRHIETIYGFDAESGELRWKNERETIGTDFCQSTTPAVVAGRLYVLSVDRSVRCVDAESGDDLWTTPLPAERSEAQTPSSVAVADGVVIALAGQLFGVDAEAGTLLWTGDREKSRGHETSPVVWDQHGRKYVICHVGGRETVCVSLRTGEELWRVETGANRSTPVVSGDRLITYGHSRKDGVRCFTLSPSGAELQWTFQRVADAGSSPVVVEGNVFVQGQNRLACVDLETGRPHWNETLDLPNPQYTSLIAADGIVFYAFDGVLAFRAARRFEPLFDAKIDESGLLATREHHRSRLGLDELETTDAGRQQAEKLWQEKIRSQGPLDCASPAIADGRLYLRLKSGVVCYDLRDLARQE